MKKLPSLGDLELVSKKIKSIPNRQKEHLRKIHHGCFLLCSQAGLRISEAVSFDLSSKTKQGLYRIEKPKGQKERLVYVSKEVIKELRKHSWKPNSTNRFNFYHFLRKIKRELNLPVNIELTPHTLRRAFATYHAENGMPLPLLQKLLGHSSIRTTALYWRNIYSEDDDKGNIDTPNILAGKKWLEREKEPPRPPVENFPELPSVNSEPIIKNEPVILAKETSSQDNPLLLTRVREKPAITNYPSQLLISGISTPRISKKAVISEQLPVLTNKKEQENQKEYVLLVKIKYLEEKLKKVQTENSNLKVVVQTERKNNQLLQATNANLTQKIHADKQNHANLINVYQKALNDKSRVEKQVNYYEVKLKTIVKTLYQWQKIKCYQQLEQEQKAQIEQPLPFKPNK